jgi:uncharacterized protein (TIGR03067 family)
VGGVVGGAEKADQDAAKLVGTWNVVTEEKDGKQETADNIKDKQVRITRDTITCADKSKQTTMAAKYKLDTSKTPWHVQFTATEGEHKGKTMAGIMQLQGDTLRVCFAKPEKDAPAGFTTKQDQCCFTLKRAE